MMPDIFAKTLEDILEDIHRKGSMQGQYTRRILEKSPYALYAGVVMPGTLPMLVFEVQATALKSVRLEHETKGYVCEVQSFKKENVRCSRITIRTAVNTFSSIFKELAPDLMESIFSAGNEKDAVKNLAERLDLWRRFMESSGSEGLTTAKVTGLFGELTFIELALGEGCEPLELLDSWTGPTRSNQDFTLGTHAIEVKTSCGNEPNLIKVSNLRQLDKTGLTHLFLFHAVFDRRSSAGLTLPDLLDRLSSKLQQESPEALRVMKDRLISLGYSHAKSDQYRSFGYTKRFFKFYKVEDDFPTLTEADVRTGVVSATYIIDLATAAAHEKPSTEIFSKFSKTYV